MATPMQEQYNSLKKEYPGAILLFRLGDFYEGFADDAKVLSKVLGLTLTGRGENANRVPMAGIPYHALPTYLPKLIRAGYKVAIADQLEEPKPGQLVRRAVTKVITAGTIVDENQLEASQNNYIASVYTNSAKGISAWGFSYCDISTGEFKLCEFRARKGVFPADLEMLLIKTRPSEILIPKDVAREFRMKFDGFLLEELEPIEYLENKLIEKLQQALNIESLKGYGLDQYSAGLVAAGKLYEYLEYNRKTALPHITEIKPLANETYMKLDEATIRNLELIIPIRSGSADRTLFSVLNHCQTPMGQRKLRQWLLNPLIDLEMIQLRHSAVSELVKETVVRENITALLDEILDLERVLARLTGNSGNARDLLFLKQGLARAIEIYELLKSRPEGALQPFMSEFNRDAIVTNVIEQIDRAIKEDPALTITEGEIIKAGFDASLDELLAKKEQGKGYINTLEQEEIQATGISNLKVRFNRVFGYFIEVSKSNIAKVPAHYIRKQTTVGGERYITDELKKWEEVVLNAETIINQKEYEIFEKVRGAVLAEIRNIKAVCESVAHIDVLNNYARLATEYNYVCPEMCEDITSVSYISNGRHAVVERYIKDFIPNETRFVPGNENCIILTGPNMSGKSTYIRQVALIQLMAQIGCFVPASEAKLVVADRIFTRVGASDNLASGESTFMVEMHEAANILHNATAKSLVILDEIGRGTSTYDGVAIAWAIVEYLIKDIGCRTLFATHYHELLILEDLFSVVKNYKVEVIEAEGVVSFMHKIVKGGVDKSYGIHVAKLAGVPGSVIARALRIQDQFQKKSVKNLLDRQMQHQQDQLGFSAEQAPEKKDKIKSALQEISIENLTPIQALNKLQELKSLLDDTK